MVVGDVQPLYSLGGGNPFNGGIYFWWPAYRLLGLLKAITAVISVSTALALLPILPKLLAMRTVEQFDASVKYSMAAKNEQLQLVMEGISAGVWDWNIVSGDVSCSPRFYELFGYEDQEFEINFDHFINHMLWSEHVAKWNAALKDQLEGGQLYKVEVKIRCKDGDFRWFETSGKAKLNDFGKAVRMVGSIIDIDSSKRLEEKDQENLEALKAKNARLQNFAYIVSHNLRSHTGNLNALLDLYPLEQGSKEKAKIFDFITSNAYQLHATVQELNDVVKVHADIEQIQTEIQLQSVVEEVTTSLSQTIEEKGAVIETDFSELESIECTATYLSSIFLNLISNALKYSSPDRPPIIKIKSTMNQAGKRILIVEDNGSGIDLSLHGDKIFGLHKTFHENSDARGVGLFLVKNQVEALGGSITVQSKVRVGTTFHVYL